MNNINELIEQHLTLISLRNRAEDILAQTPTYALRFQQRLFDALLGLDKDIEYIETSFEKLTNNKD